MSLYEEIVRGGELIYTTHVHMYTYIDRYARYNIYNNMSNSDANQIYFYFYLKIFYLEDLGMRIQRSYDEFFYMREEKTAFSASAAASPLMDLKDQTRTL